MSSFLIYLAVFVLVGAGISVLIVMLKEKYKEDEYRDYPLVINYIPQYTNGHAFGELISIDKNGDRYGIKFMPKDIDYLRRINEDKKLEINPEIVFIERDKIINFPRGTLSSERNLIMLLPPRSEELSPEILNTDFGKVYSKMIEDQNIKNNVIDILRNKGEVEDILLKRVVGLDIVKEYILVDGELNKDRAKKVLDLINDKKLGSSSYHPPYGGSQ